MKDTADPKDFLGCSIPSSLFSLFHCFITYGVLWEVTRGERVLEEMSNKGFNPPVRGRDLLIEGLLNAGYLESAKDVVRRMMKEGFVPDVNTFNSLVEAICNAGEVDFCVDMYHSVCKLGFCPDINSYKILIPAVS
uniref:Pentacotripeptide-repeat region of PRORP domain-containing protein n=1 Tax=Salix viminalis TaxID=40686 RepID=A0A6N2MIP9_SALVM